MRCTTPLALAAVFALTGCPAPTEGTASAEGTAPAESQGNGEPPTPPPPAPARASTFGSFSEAGVRMEIKAVVPVWDAEEGELTLYALPFEPNDEQRDACRKDKVFFMLMDREHDLPGFSDRTPYAHVALSWPFDEEDVGKAEKASVHVFVNGLGTKGSNMNISRGGGEGIELSGELAVGSPIEFRGQGETEISGTAIEWDLTFSGELLASLEE